MKLLKLLFIYSLTVDLGSSQCRMANWWGSFDRWGWSTCGSTKEYITGMYRNTNRGNDDKIYLLEEVKCCQAIAPNRESQSTCTNANWWSTLDSNYKWAVCPAGHFLQGLYRTVGHWLYNIEEGKCCKPAGFPNTYAKCVDKDIGLSFDKHGLSSCDDGYYMAGFYRGSCDKLYCIEKIRCCKMYESSPQPAQECSSYQVIDDATRSRGYQTNSAQCDRSMATKWYRFQGASGTQMPTSCVTKNRCGTHAPGWLSGTHPTVAQGIQTAKVCFHWNSNCCEWLTNIRVRNCGGFFVYELKAPPVCHLRYCGTAGPGPTLPPECLNYQYLGDPSRARGYEGNSVTCDKPLPTKWYRLSDSAGSEMPTSCVTKNRCGTHAPGWLSGAHPTVAQGIQSVKVCFHWLDNCCMWSTNIRVRNCDGYYVYELKTPPACHLRYCGNSDRNFCAHSQCKNGATCVNLQGSYRCACKSGFSGVNCQADVNECANNPCRNGATCVNLQGSYRCDCKSGYNSKNCETDINECSPDPCKNGATCVNLVGSHRCDCKSGYTGSNCEIDINECSPNPCHNGGTCFDLVGSHRCDCKSGYTGSNCEIDINECSPNPCQNGATCVDLVGSHRCDCKSGYSGSNCEIDINECSPNPCQNGATCVDLVGSHRCDCKSGYTGSSCETDINECSPNPCQNGATCVDLVGSHRCDCKSGYTGSSCETDINECSPNPCQNGATCVNLVGSHRCDCKSGYTGSNCEIDINECSPNPCQNGGTCVNLVGSHRCDCQAGYTGGKCETDINECSSDPCQNEGTCVDLVGGYRCDCKSGHTGTNCETVPLIGATQKPEVESGYEEECNE